MLIDSAMDLLSNSLLNIIAVNLYNIVVMTGLYCVLLESHNVLKVKVVCVQWQQMKDRLETTHGKKEGNGSIVAGGNLGSAAKGSAIDLDVAGSGPVSCRFFIPFSFLPCVLL